MKMKMTQDEVGLFMAANPGLSTLDKPASYVDGELVVHEDNQKAFEEALQGNWKADGAKAKVVLEAQAVQADAAAKEVEAAGGIEVMACDLARRLAALEKG